MFRETFTLFSHEEERGLVARFSSWFSLGILRAGVKEGPNAAVPVEVLRTEVQSEPAGWGESAYQYAVLVQRGCRWWMTFSAGPNPICSSTTRMFR